MWATRKLRGERVWAKLDANGQLATGSDGRVDIRYREGGKVYRAGARNLDADPAVETLDDDAVAAPPAATPADGAKHAAKPKHVVAKRPTSGAPIIVYTDGACTGNPGPMGVGVVIMDGKERTELSEYLGEGTNNIAELTAIAVALRHLPRERPVRVHSDSAYALGLLGKGWRAKANQELVAALRALAAEFADITWVKVEGHAGVPENERCDQLARDAVSHGRRR